MAESVFSLKEKTMQHGFPTFNLPASTQTLLKMTDQLNIIFDSFGI